MVGAAAWALPTGVTGYKIGFAAIGIGLLVGKAVEREGRGDSRLPLPAAVIALLGCLLGDLLVDAHEVAAAVDVSYGSVLRTMLAHPCGAVDVYRAGFSALDLAFYAVAAVQGYRFAAIGLRRHQERTNGPAPLPQWPAPLTEEPATWPAHPTPGTSYMVDEGSGGA